MRRAPLLAIVCAPWLLACAGDLVLRSPQHGSPRGDVALAAIDPVAVALPPPEGGGGSREPVGRIDGTLGGAEGSIFLTEDPAAVVRRLVAHELRSAGHRLVEEGGDATVAVRVLEFEVQSRGGSLGWDLLADVRVALLVSRRPGDEGATELVYTAERSTRTLLRPSVRTLERILAECLDDLAGLVAQREELAASLERYARPALRLGESPD